MTTRVILVQLLLLVVAQVAWAQKQSTGTCPKFQSVQDFDLSKYLGKWHGYAKYPQRRFANNDCSTVFYSDGTKPGGLPTVNVINRAYNQMTGTYGRIVGTATALDASVPAALRVYFPVSPKPPSATPNYNVIGTDYDNYALVYDCRQISNYEKEESLYVLTRERQPTQEVVDQAYKGLTDQGISLEGIQLNTQTNCPTVTPDSGPQESTYNQRPVQLAGVSGPQVFTYRQRPVQLVGVRSPYYYSYPHQYQRLHYYY